MTSYIIVVAILLVVIRYWLKGKKSLSEKEQAKNLVRHFLRTPDSLEMDERVKMAASTFLQLYGQKKSWSEKDVDLYINGTYSDSEARLDLVEMAPFLFSLVRLQFGKSRIDIMKYGDWANNVQHLVREQLSKAEKS